MNKLFLLLYCFASLSAQAEEWQWSVTNNGARVFLWIPPECEHVRGVVIANHNIIEQDILEHPVMRRTLSELNIAAIWAVRGLSLKFDFNAGEDQQYDRVLKALADVSGYDELATCPVVPMGHSANATWVWNFAAWKPERTLAVLSLHGDAPQTLLTGYGGENVWWGGRTLDGVPGLMVMSELEWWDARLWPAMLYRIKHSKTPLAVLGDAGNGHMNSSDELVDFLALFLRKAVAARVQPDGRLKPVNPQTGWLLDRWRKDQTGGLVAGPFNSYTGNVDEAFWCFDEEMARAEQAYYAKQRGKRPQLIGVEGMTGGRCEPKLELLDDGLSFRLNPHFVDRVPDDGHARGWTGLPTGSPLGHATGTISMGWIFGPAVKTGADTFRIQFNRADSVPDGRNNDIWLFGMSPGDAEYKQMVQAVLMRVPKFGGAEQHLTFPEIPDQPAEAKTVRLQATSDAGLPVRYYVREGPAEIDGDTVVFTVIPPRSRLPISVTVVAWQLGRGGESPVKRAPSVAQTFHIVSREPIQRAPQSAASRE